MRAMVEQEVVSRVADAEQALSVVQLHTALVGESELSTRLAPVEASLPAGTRIAYLAAPAAVRVRFVGAGSGPEEAARHARSILGDLVVAEGDGTLAGSLCRALGAAGATLASAESLTGGLVGAAVTSVPGASAVYAGGVVAYATAAKEALLGVDAALLDAYGAVSPEVAAAMARGVRSRFGATYGVATTGVAGPDPQDGRPVGTVHVAVDGPAGRRTCRLVRPGSRAVVRERAVLAALELARRACLGLPPGPSE
jgi:nicotinamide-nucleotide amidase